MRCTIKTLKSKVLPLVLCVSLSLGLCLSGAFADGSGFSIPSESSDILDLLSSFGAPNSVINGIVSDINTLVSHDLEESSIEVLFFQTSTPNALNQGCGCFVFNLGYNASGNPISPVVNLEHRNNSYYYFNSDISVRYKKYEWQNGNSWYVVPSGWSAGTSVLITSTVIDLPSSRTLYDNNFLMNLDLENWFPSDTRIFEVWKSVDYPESSNPLEYINVRLDGYVDLNKISTQKIRFDYTDSDGNNHYKVFSESDFHDIHYDIFEDVYTFYLFPYLISSYEFTITAATYYSDLVEWGSKTIELDLTYNEGTIYPLPQDWNSVYTVNQYFQSRSNGTFNTGVSLLALSDSGYFWIDNNRKVCHQVFDVKALFIPYFMNSDLLSINLETLFQLYEQYDVIFTGVQPTQFNTLIPTLDYNDLYVYYSQNGFYPALQKLQEYYVFYHNLDYQHTYSDYTWTLSTDNVGFIVTRSFLLKRSLTALGDIDNRLLEFESNLVGEDSLGASLQTKLDNILSLEHDFFTDVSNFFQKLEYNLNGLSLGRIEKYLEDIWSASVGERNFNYTDLLPEPLKSIFLYFRGWFISSTQYMQDFIDVSNSSLYGDDLMTLPFEATVVPVLPFEPGTPTPIPIPTLEAGLIEVGGD